MFRVLAAKDPDARVAYQFDLSAYFRALRGDALDVAEVMIVDEAGQQVASDLIVDAISSSALGIVTFWLSGGTPGRRYFVQCRFSGSKLTPVRTRDRVTIIIPVSQL